MNLIPRFSAESYVRTNLYRVLLWTLVCSAFLSNLNPAFAQEPRQIPPSEIVLSDSINWGDSSRHGFINKIIQPFRFRENQIQKERQRMVLLIRRLTEEGDLNIDTATVSAIVNDLINLTNEQEDAQKTSARLEEEIHQALVELDLKAPLDLVDSVKVQLGNVLQGLMDETKEANLAQRKAMMAKLSALRQIQFSCGSPELPTYETTVGDSLLVRYQNCLKAETRIFGWHLAEMGNKYQNYNFNYLSDLILHGYELGGNGLENNPDVLQKMLEGGIIKRLEHSGKHASLSVYSYSAPLTSSFLNQKNSQDRFLRRIKELVESHGLQGISIYFETIRPKDSAAFTQFIAKLRSELTVMRPNLLLTVGIPAISNTENLSIASALDFPSLNALVDYYMVMTQNLNITATRIPFSRSPLYPDQANPRGSIEGTFSQYSNGKVPINKLVMTVSYQGISWPMPDFIPGSRATGLGTSINFNTIQQTILPTVGQYDGAVLGYDPEQAAAYLNYGEIGNLKQLWFEDARSLSEKYNWALENQVGGVGIWGLGFDEGYTELWDAIGANLIYIDSMVLDTTKVLSKKEGTKLGFWNYVKIYFNDVQWAGVNDIYLGDPNNSDYCYFDPYPSREAIQELKAQYEIDDFWLHPKRFKKYDNTEFNALDSYQQCISLLGRWDRYAELNGKAAIILFILLFVAGVTIFLGVKTHGDEWVWRVVLTHISIGIGLLSLISVFFYAFFSTHIGFLGAGSNEVTMAMVLLIFTVGILSGVIINYLIMSRKYSNKDLP